MILLFFALILKLCPKYSRKAHLLADVGGRTTVIVSQCYEEMGVINASRRLGPLSKGGPCYWVSKTL
jgi:hypothetical protein